MKNYFVVFPMKKSSVIFNGFDRDYDSDLRWSVNWRYQIMIPHLHMHAHIARINFC